jgi:hypothetical protein
MTSITARAEVSYMGLEADDVLFMSGPRFGESYPCSNWYNNGSIANKWCHGMVAKVTHSILTEAGASELVGHAGAVIVLSLWESTNIRFDPTDIVTAPLVYNINETTKAAISLDMGGGIIMYLSKDF